MTTLARKHVKIMRMVKLGKKAEITNGGILIKCHSREKKIKKRRGAENSNLQVVNLHLVLMKMRFWHMNHFVITWEDPETEGSR